VTASLSVLAVVLSFAIAVPGVAARVAPSPWLRAVSRGYVEVVRNTPLIVLLYLVYFGLASSGIRITSYLAGLVALTLHSAAYTIEIYRGGIAGIDPGQRAAGAALGLGRIAMWRHVVLPQALRFAFPALGNQVIGVVLGSSLVMVVAAPDLTSTALLVGSATFRYFEVFIVAAVIYMIVVQCTSAGWILVGRIFLPAHH
jgi:polar amino acid transport system permease protein